MKRIHLVFPPALVLVVLVTLVCILTLIYACRDGSSTSPMTTPMPCLGICHGRKLWQAVRFFLLKYKDIYNIYIYMYVCVAL